MDTAAETEDAVGATGVDAIAGAATVQADAALVDRQGAVVVEIWTD